MTQHDNEQIIRDFCDGWEASDADALVDAFTEDAVYHNIPMDPVEGREAIEAVIRGFLGRAQITFHNHRQVTDGDLVMNERTDVITTDGSSVSLPVMGVFELRDGKISAWRDYFDLAMFRGS
tara:strand:+ start:377 stop:742 length:366 start_codon:yes stop_codon:yes gene_type:complete